MALTPESFLFFFLPDEVSSPEEPESVSESESESELEDESESESELEDESESELDDEEPSSLPLPARLVRTIRTLDWERLPLAARATAVLFIDDEVGVVEAASEDEADGRELPVFDFVARAVTIVGCEFAVFSLRARVFARLKA